MESVNKDMMKMVCSAFEFQHEMNRLQAFPVVGPLLVSPVKAVVDLAIIVGALASAILFAPLSFNYSCRQIALVSCLVVVAGCVDLLGSIANIASLGIFGYLYESYKEEQRHKIYREAGWTYSEQECAKWRAETLYGPEYKWRLL
jgi:hypothetical protein